MADVSAEFMAGLKARLAATMDAMRSEPDDAKRLDIACRAAIKQATPQVISALLWQAGFGPAEATPHRSTAGHSVRRAIGEGVFITWWPDSQAGPGEGPKQARLDEYARMIAASGYEVERKRFALVVTTAEDQEG